MELPAGKYLVSNLYVSRLESKYAEEIASLGEREQQWKRIVEAGVSQRLCRVFKNEEHHMLRLMYKDMIAMSKELETLYKVIDQLDHILSD